MSARTERLDALKRKVRDMVGSQGVHESVKPGRRGRSYVLEVDEFEGWPVKVSAHDEGLAWARLHEQLERREEKSA